MQNPPDAAASLASIVEPLLAFYDQNKRPLPWRMDPSPYHVWISEIMLQQTRIEAVLPYYERFLAACPTVEALAAIDDDDLMKLWEGLGYYSRARNLKKAAIIICEHGGEMPNTYEGLLALPGVGSYTAGAIASIAFGLPEPAVDGNVLRVIARLCADDSDILLDATKKRVTDALRAIYPHDPFSAASLTQALMELGETICPPNKDPHCEECPLGLFCLARIQGRVDELPHRSEKKPRKIQNRTILLLWCRGKIAIRRRAPAGLLAGLYEFPGVEDAKNVKDALAAFPSLVLADVPILPAGDAKHIFTHIEWRMTGYHISVREESGAFLWVTPEELKESYALPSAFRAYANHPADPFLP